MFVCRPVLKNTVTSLADAAAVRFPKPDLVCASFLLFSTAHAKGFSGQLLHHRCPSGPELGLCDVPARANKASVRDLPLSFPSLLTLCLL